jgi:hypothetical protein
MDCVVSCNGGEKANAAPNLQQVAFQGKTGSLPSAESRSAISRVPKPLNVVPCWLVFAHRKWQIRRSRFRLVDAAIAQIEGVRELHVRLRGCG